MSKSVAPPDTTGLSIAEAAKRLDWWAYGTHQNTPEAADVRLLLLVMRERGYIKGKECLDFSTCDDCRGVHAKHCPAYVEGVHFDPMWDAERELGIAVSPGYRTAYGDRPHTEHPCWCGAPVGHGSSVQHTVKEGETK